MLPQLKVPPFIWYWPDPVPENPIPILPVRLLVPPCWVKTPPTMECPPALREPPAERTTLPPVVSPFPPILTLPWILSPAPTDWVKLAPLVIDPLGATVRVPAVTFVAPL